jgi:hypothetical protein
MQRDRVLHHLAAIRRDVDQLAALERSWCDGVLSSNDRIGYGAEWENTVDRFSAVVNAYADGQIDHEVAVQVVDVAQLLVAFTPHLERMHLRQPSADDLRRVGILSAA